MTQNEQQARILVIDDDPHLLRAAVRLMEKNGYEVFSAESGAEGLDLTRKILPDLVLLDVVMPGMGGIEVCQAIKEDPDLEHVFVVMVSSLRVASERQAAGLEAGADDYIARPVSNREFVARVNALLRIKRAENGLRESERRFKALFQGMPGPVYTWQTNGDDFVLVDHNAAADAITGGKIGDFVGMSAKTMYPDRPDIVADIARCYAEKVTIEREMEYQFKTTGERKVLVVKYAFVPPDLVLVQTEDISERVRAEEQLAYQAHLLANVNDAILATDDQFVVTAWNRAAEEIHGWKAEEAIGRLVQEVIPSDFTEVQTEEALRSLAENGSYRVEISTRHKDGQPIEVEGTTVALRGKDGRVTGYASVNRDITERVQAQAELEASEEKYRDLVEKISDVIYSVDTEGVITYLNPTIEALIGLPPEQVVGQPFGSFIHPEDLGRVRGNVQDLLTGRVPGPAEYRVLNASGETRWISVTSQPVVDEGQIPGLQGVLSDITDRKRAEAQLEEKAKAAERQRLAAELHDSVTQTLFSASLIAQTVQRLWERDSEEGRRGLEHLQRFILGALAEMRTLLLELNPAALEAKELSVLLRQLADATMVRTSATVTTTVVGECTLPNEVKVVLYRIAQEALNNVVKYAGAQRVKVNLQCLEKDIGVLDGEGDQPQTILSIRDDGGGFDPEDPGVAGLGLGTMRDRAREIDATLTITSQPGKGTEVLVEW